MLQEAVMMCSEGEGPSIRYTVNACNIYSQCCEVIDIAEAT